MKDDRHSQTINAVVAATAVVSIAAELLSMGVNPLRMVSGIVLVTFGTGYALLAALFPAREMAVDRVQRLWWSIPTSFAVAIVIGVLLDSTPIGLAGRPYVLLLGFTTIGCLGYARLRERWRSPTGHAGAGTEHAVSTAGAESLHRGAVPTRQIRATPRRARRMERGWLLFTAPLLLLALLWAMLGILQAARTDPKPFTALSLERVSDGAATPSLRITISNREERRMEYDLEVRPRTSEIMRWEAISVDAGADSSIDLSPEQFGADGDLEVVLFVHGSPQPYRTLRTRG